MLRPPLKTLCYRTARLRIARAAFHFAPSAEQGEVEAHAHRTAFERGKEALIPLQLAAIAFALSRALAAMAAMDISFMRIVPGLVVVRFIVIPLQDPDLGHHSAEVLGII